MMEKRFDRIIVFFYCLLIFFLPISIALTETMAGLVCFFLALKKGLVITAEIKALGGAAVWRDKYRVIIKHLKPNDCYLNWPMAVFIAACFVSVVFSTHLKPSLMGFFGKLLEGYLLYFAFIECFTTARRFTVFFLFYIASSLLMGTNGIAQYITHAEFVRGNPLVDKRVSSTFRHANDFGAYLVIVIPLVLAFLLQPWGKMAEEWKKNRLGTSILSKLIAALTLGALIASLGLTFSRSSWAGFVLSLIIVLIISRKYLVLLFIGVLFFVLFMPMLIKVRDVSFTSDNVSFMKTYGNLPLDQKSFDGYNDVTRDRVLKARDEVFGGMGRSTYWTDALEIIKKYPLIGSGLNTYSLVAKRGYPHNSYLQMTAEIGVIGILTFLFLIGALTVQTIREACKMTDNYTKILVSGALGGFCGFMLQSSLDTTLFSVQLGTLMWIFMGMVVALSRLGAGRLRTS